MSVYTKFTIINNILISPDRMFFHTPKSFDTFGGELRAIFGESKAWFTRVKQTQGNFSFFLFLRLLHNYMRVNLGRCACFTRVNQV